MPGQLASPGCQLAGLTNRVIPLRRQKTLGRLAQSDSRGEKVNPCRPRFSDHLNTPFLPSFGIPVGFYFQLLPFPFQRFSRVRFRVQVGCGAGNTIYPLLAGDPHVFVHACDFSPRAVDLVKVGIGNPEKKPLTATPNRTRHSKI